MMRYSLIVINTIIIVIIVIIITTIIKAIIANTHLLSNLNHFIFLVYNKIINYFNSS